MSQPWKTSDAIIETALGTLEAARTDVSPSETIVPSTRVADEVTSLLSRLDGGTSNRFTMERTLGSGGMGVVHLAEQKSLGRKVAIKTLREDLSGPIPMRKVLQEAWITGYLEHPNIVPVYDIARDDTGRPVIVLKRIEGESLFDILADRPRIERRFATSDPFEWILRVVIQVCHALAHAHRHGIVHRDVKAENVMVGPHGEVYLLDWGIAVAMEDDGTGRLPLARHATAIAGTPCYMAPEMLGGEDSRLGPWTDVYLLGSLLFEVVTGRVPHTGDNLPAILHSVLRSPPTMGADAPEELRRIVARAMDADPHARFENAEQVRHALEAFLSHRGSRRLVERADKSAAIMEQALQGGDSELAEASFAEARFGYQAALEQWEANEDGRHKLRRMTEVMLRSALADDDAQGAARIVASAEQIAPELRAEVATALEAAQRKRASLAALERDSDETRGRRTRAFVALVLCVIWVSAPLITHAFTGPPGYRAQALFSMSIFLFTGALMFWARQSMTSTRINRALALGLLATMGGQVAMALAGWQLGVDPQKLHILWLAIFATAAAWGTATIYRGGWPSVLAFAVALACSSTWPAYHRYFLASANAVLLVNMLYLNRAAIFLREGVERARRRRSEKP